MPRGRTSCPVAYAVAKVPDSVVQRLSRQDSKNRTGKTPNLPGKFRRLIEPGSAIILTNCENP